MGEVCRCVCPCSLLSYCRPDSLKNKPTLNPDSSQWRDIVLFSRCAAPWHQYQRDDIVSVRLAFQPFFKCHIFLTRGCRSPEDPKRILIKRILATEGDIVKTLPPYPDREVLVPKGHAWIEGIYTYISDHPTTYILLGDEHFLSDDSNRFGAVRFLNSPLFNLVNQNSKISQGLIQSKFVLILWPLPRFGFLKSTNSRVNAEGQLDRQALAEMRRDEVRHSRVQHAPEC